MHTFTYFEFKGFWRIPFLLALFLSYYIASCCKNLSKNSDNKLYNLPLKVVIENLIKEYDLILITIVIGSFIGTIFYGIYTFPIGFLSTRYNLNTSALIAISSFGFVLYMFLLPIMGLVADRLGHIRQMQWSTMMMILTSYAIFSALISQSYYYIIIAQAFSSFILASFVAPASYVLPKIFSKNVRHIGLAFGYNVGVCIFGGSAPTIFLICIENSQSAIIPSMVIAFVALIGFCCATYLVHIYN